MLDPRLINLKDEDHEILDLLVEGLHDNEIARKLQLTPVTIQRRMQRMRARLDFDNRTEMAVWWVRRQYQMIVDEKVEFVARRIEKSGEVLGLHPHIFQVAEYIRGFNSLPEAMNGNDADNVGRISEDSSVQAELEFSHRQTDNG